MINFFSGPEGAGKTALMTYFSRKHYLAGGEVWAFPGWELKNNTGRVVSKLIMPEEIMGKLDDMQYIFLNIDEIQNFSNHHHWQSAINDVLAYGAMAQRRKREFVLNVTGPEFKFIPPDLKILFHLVFNCRDAHWRNREISRGQEIRFTITDNRGVLSGYPGFTTYEKKFFPKDYFRYYETLSLVDPKYQNRKFKVKQDVTWVDSEGNPIEKDNNEPVELIKIAQKVSELKAQGLKKLESWKLYPLLSELGMSWNVTTKSLFSQVGVHYDRKQGSYLLD